jgi:hypothetical protein
MGSKKQNGHLIENSYNDYDLNFSNLEKQSP